MNEEHSQDRWDTLLSGSLHIEPRDHAAVERALAGVRRHRSRSVLGRWMSGSLAAAAVLAGLSLWPHPSGDPVSPQYAYEVYSEVSGW